MNIPTFAEKISPHFPLRPNSIRTLQVNVGKKCNQACRHCHVDASPARTEMMTAETAATCIAVLRNNPEIEILDLTGGAPEMNPSFRKMVVEAKKLGKHIIDRCNLTILEVHGYEYLYEFLRDHQVEVIASLPFYSAANTDSQRGVGVFNTSITALRKLNQLGYGETLPLQLVYNPNGFFLSAPQAGLEKEFKEQLQSRFDIRFHNLYCINNMPIHRFLDSLIKRGKYQEYMEVLVNAYNPATLSGLMCRNQISVGYDGQLYDCDFNQMLDMTMSGVNHISEFNRERILNRTIEIGNHCYGCTAGAGSSCGGEIKVI